MGLNDLNPSLTIVNILSYCRNCHSQFRPGDSTGPLRYGALYSAGLLTEGGRNLMRNGPLGTKSSSPAPAREMESDQAQFRGEPTQGSDRLVQDGGANSVPANSSVVRQFCYW